jgi:hypothetical protein
VMRWGLTPAAPAGEAAPTPLAPIAAMARQAAPSLTESGDFFTDRTPRW